MIIFLEDLERRFYLGPGQDWKSTRGKPQGRQCLSMKTQASGTSGFKFECTSDCLGTWAN